MKKNTLLCLLIIGIPILLGFLCAAIEGWHYVFDDAFISYRYAKNLAMGHGITWNPGCPPTEGYTNFLLVIGLAPFIKAGLDPLFITRVLSYLSVAVIAVALFILAKRRTHCSTPAALMVASLILLSPQTRHLCLVGLETVIYTLFLLLTVVVGVEVLQSRRARDSLLLGVLLVLTMMLRPEAVLLCPVLLLLYCMGPRPGRSLDFRSLTAALVGPVLLGGACLVWKAIHFGHLLPNPFYIKASSTALISRMGLTSVLSFLSDNALLLAISYASLLLCLAGSAEEKSRNKTPVVFGLAVIAVYVCFFAHTDTLMDIRGRFLYPLVPIVITAALPALVAALRAVESWAQGKALRCSGVAVGFLLAFSPADLLHAARNVRGLMPRDDWRTSNSLMQKEYRLAKALATFPEIDKVRIACGDSGVIPYFTNAVWLDTVGLNDGFIARNRNRQDLVDYYFQWAPDLVIKGGNKDYTWPSYGHGPLGDFTQWANDPRWDEYGYAGSSKTSGGIYDLHFFVRRSSRFSASLKDFLQRTVVDGWYDPLPYPLGTWTPKMDVRPAWTPRPESPHRSMSPK